MINKDRTFFQYNSGDLFYIISPIASQLHTASRKGMIKYVGPVGYLQNDRSTQLSINDIR